MSAIDVHNYEDDETRLRLVSNIGHKAGIEQIPGARYVGRGRNFWTIPKTFAGLSALVNTFPSKVSVAPEVLEWFQNQSEFVNGVFGLIEQGLPQETRDAIQGKLLAPFDFTAKNHQTDAAVHLNTVKGGGLFDEQGLGKTLSVAMALMLYPDNYPALIVCPKSVLWNWKRELARLGIESDILIGTAAQRRKIFERFDPEVTPVLITSYDMVKAHSRLAGYGNIALKRSVEYGGKNPAITEKQCEVRPRELNEIDWVTVICDEAHRIRFPKTAQTRAVWAVSEGAKNRWALTGTPVEQSPMEFWSLLRFMDPIEWSVSTKYRDRYVLTFDNYFGGVDILGLRPDTEEEFKKVTGYRWLRRLPEDAGIELPELTTEYRYCELSPKERKAYKQMEEQLMALDEEGNPIIAENHMVKQGRLCQMANATLQISDDGETTHMVEPSSKLDLMMDTLQDFPDDEPIILWFDNVDLLKLASARLEAKGRAHSTVYGNLDAKRVDEEVQRFQNGEVDLILLTEAKGGEGITLTRSRVAIFVQRNPRLILNLQADKRNRRIGSEVHMAEGILHVNLVALGTVEEELYDEKLPEKQRKADEVVAR